MCNSLFLRRLLILVPATLVFLLGLEKSDVSAILLGVSLLAILYELLALNDQTRMKNSIKRELAELSEKIDKLDEKISNSCWY